MLSQADATTYTLLGQIIPVKGYFVEVLGAAALNMGVFVGIISGFVGGIVYNKYYNFRKLPDCLAFFNGKRFVPLMVIIYSGRNFCNFSVFSGLMYKQVLIILVFGLLIHLLLILYLLHLFMVL